MLEVIGVHPVAADEPVHLIHVAIRGRFGDVDWGSITQPQPGQPRDNWQVPCDERELDRLPDGRAQTVFFFHSLDVTRPLQAPRGLIRLPAPSPMPDGLSSIKYLEP